MQTSVDARTCYVHEANEHRSGVALYNYRKIQPAVNPESLRDAVIDEESRNTDYAREKPGEFRMC